MEVGLLDTIGETGRHPDGIAIQTAVHGGGNLTADMDDETVMRP